jgi:hypothetical protein
MDVSENRKHRTDAELVAFLDGELETQARASVAEHLDTCWHCRARLSAFQASMESVARASDESSRRSPADPVSAARLLLMLERQITLPEAAPPAQRIRYTPVYAFAAAAVVLALIVGALFTRPAGRQSAPPQPLSAAAIRQQVEASEMHEAVPGVVRHQVYALELESAKPAKRSIQNRVEIWSDGRRQSIKLEGHTGMLRYAAWRAEGSVLAERGKFAGNRSARARLGECVSADEAEAFVTAFLRRQTSGRLRLAAGLFRELERSGFTLEQEALRLDGRVRLVARQKQESFQESAWLDVDPVRHAPVALGLSSETASAAWKLVLRLEKEESPPLAAVPADAFVPESAATPVAVSTVVASVPDIAPVNEDFDQRELSAIAFTSRWRKPGEHLQVERLPDQGIFINGRVTDADRKSEVARLLDAWPGLSFSVQATGETATSGWCSVASAHLFEAAETARVMERLEQHFTKPELAAELRALRDRVATEQTAGFASAVEELDRLLRPIRGSAPAAVVVVKGPLDALATLSSLIRHSCDSASDGLMPEFGVEARGQILGLIVTLKEFRWTIGMPVEPSRRVVNQEN